MDPASLSLSVLPLIVGALKGYRIVHRKCRMFCDYSREVRRLQKKVRQQRQLFKTECELLLRLVIPEGSDVVENMLDDITHYRWQDASLDTKVRNILKDNLQCCVEAVEDIQENLEELQTELRAFDQLGDHRLENEPIKDTIRRLRGALKVTFKKTDHEHLLDELRSQNEVLCRLRGYAQTFEALAVAEQHVVRKQWPRSITGIRNASEKLHETLTQKAGPGLSSVATLRLCLEAQEIGETVCLDLVISGDLPSQDSQERTHSSLLQLRQITVETVNLSTDEETDHSLHCGWLQNSVTGSKRSCASASLSIPAKQRKVRFVDDLNCSASATATKTLSISSVQLHPISTQNYQNICQQLMAKACLSHISTARCPGLLETINGPYKHVFHSSMDCTMKTCCQSIVPRAATVLTLHDALGKPVEESVEMIDQLRLARRLVIGVVQFHGTSWLGEDWDSRDVAVFSRDGEFSGSALRTLHCIQSPKPAVVSAQDAMEGLEFVPLVTPDGLRTGTNLKYKGILNAVMYCLGLQLIRIAYWSPLENLDVPDARRLLDPAMRRPPLGRRYQELTRKCLECDFGFGKDLTRPALLNAIHMDVVSVLDELIGSVAALNLCED